MHAILLVAALSALPQTPRGERAEPVDLTAVLAGVREAHDVPALGALVLSGGTVTHLGAVGTRRRGSDVPVTVDDRWHLGSCTKAMTATVIGDLVEQGKVEWATKLPALFPDIEVHEDLAEVTLSQLLSHNAGLLMNPTVGDLWLRLTRHAGPVREARELVAERVLRPRPAYEPGVRFVYSNTGFLIAGAAAERLADRPWETILRARLFAPLGMASAGFGAPGVPDAPGEDPGAPSEPRGHDAAGRPVEPGPGADSPAAYGPAGTVHASLRDWARFIDLHLRGARGESGLLLKAATLQTLQRPRSDGYHALGWGVTQRDWSDGQLLVHSGTNKFWYCTVWVAPDDDFALLVVCNQGRPRGQSACEAACTAVLRRLGKIEAR